MDSAKLNDWMQVVGIFAVVASLIFVGMQMKQSQDIAVASQYSERAAEVREFFHARAESPVQLEYLGYQHREHLKSVDAYKEEMTAEEIGSFFLINRASLAFYDNNYYQFQAGFMTDEAWQPYKNIMELQCSSNSFVKLILMNHPDFYRESFVDYFHQVSCESN